MKAHAIVVAAALAFCLLLSAMAPYIDQGIDYNNLRGAAKFQAREAVKP